MCKWSALARACAPLIFPPPLQTASLSTQYSKGLDGITAVIILTVSLAILYYVIVLGAEISVLGTAASRGKSALLRGKGTSKLFSTPPPGPPGGGREWGWGL